MNGVMDRAGLFCSAYSDSSISDEVTANFKLPTPLDLTQNDFEIALIYASFVPSWLVTKELYLISNKLVNSKHVPRLDSSLSDDDGDYVLPDEDHSSKHPLPKSSSRTVEILDTENEVEKLHFKEIQVLSKEEVMQSLKNQLQATFGTKNPRVKLTLQQQRWYLVIQSKSSVELSKQLAKLLSLPEIINNTHETRQLSSEISFLPSQLNSYGRILYIGCDQLRQNFSNNAGEKSRLLDLIHLTDISNDRPIEHYPHQVRYMPLEEGLLTTLKFSLYNRHGLLVEAHSSDFFLFFHIRKQEAHDKIEIF